MENPGVGKGGGVTLTKIGCCVENLGDAGKREGVRVNTNTKVGCYVGNSGFGKRAGRR